MSDMNFKSREIITDLVDEIRRIAESKAVDPATICYVAARTFGEPDEDLVSVYEDALIKFPGL